MDVRTVADLSPAERLAFFERDAGVDAVRDDVSEIVDRVRTEGDVALREFSEEFDGVAVGNIDITDDAERAHAEFDDANDPVLDAVRDAAANIREFHERQHPRTGAMSSATANSAAGSARSTAPGCTCPAARRRTLQRTDGRDPGGSGGRRPRLVATPAGRGDQPRHARGDPRGRRRRGVSGRRRAGDRRARVRHGDRHERPEGGRARQ